jgi:hypothetical protein
MSAAVALACAIALGSAAPARGAEVHRHVVVVGVNTSVDANVAPLSYADDDAARYAEVFAGASSLRVLSVLDADTQRLFPDVAKIARAPTVDEFDRAIAESFAEVKRDRDAGKDADFVLVVIGHGAVGKDGEGYVSLLDGKLTRSKLLDLVIAASPARFNHVIVDACSAYHVLYRGDSNTNESDADAIAAVHKLVEAHSLSRFPNTGVLLATSSARETHEWSRIKGGVFSHEVLAALSGAADVDGDGDVSYAEIGAFIEAANAGVVDERARVEFTLRPPPMWLARPLASTPKTGPRIALASTDTGHFVVEDARGIPMAEVNKSSEQPLTLALSKGAAPFRVVRGDDEWLDEIESTVALAKLSHVASNDGRGDRVASRSGVSDALAAGLFTTPFGRGYVAGYSARLAREDGVATSTASAASLAGASTSGTSTGGASAQLATAAHSGIAPREAGAALSSTTPFPWAATSATILSGATLAGAAITAGFAINDVAALDAGVGKIDAIQAQHFADNANAMWIASGAFAAAGIASGAIAAALFVTP